MDDVRAAPASRRAFLLLAAVLLVAVTVQIEGGWASGGTGDLAWLFEVGFYNAVPIAAGLACILGGRRSRDERRAWLLIGLGPLP